MAVGSVDLRYRGKLSMWLFRNLTMLLIIAIAWIYVVLLMSIVEQSVIAGIMTFLLYGVLPLIIILYLLAVPQRKKRRALAAASMTASQPDGFEQSIITSASSSSPAPTGIRPDTTSDVAPGQPTSARE